MVARYTFESIDVDKHFMCRRYYDEFFWHNNVCDYDNLGKKSINRIICVQNTFLRSHKVA